MRDNKYSMIDEINYILQKKGYIEIPSRGVSMYPLIKEGDLCRFVPIQSMDELIKGDIVLYQSKQGHIVGHRFYDKIEKDSTPYYIFKGDTHLNPDSPVPESHLIGKLVRIKKRTFSIEPFGRIAQLWGCVVRLLPVLPRFCKALRCFRTRIEKGMRSTANYKI